MLTASGVQALGGGEAANGLPARVVPYWYGGPIRCLLWMGCLVKDFHQREAPSQIPLLEAFQEEGWQRHIDDPLPCTKGIDPRDRLHEAVRALNEHQVRCLLVFERDGTGEGITWRPRHER